MRDDPPPGRSCPLHYRYAPDALSGLDVLYVVGGLYGNGLALQRVLELFDRETGRKRLVFNGDFHWFDAFACTHTCLPVFQALRSSDGRGHRWILNNGATGMPNFAGDGAGLLTRIAATPFAGRERRYGVRAGKAHVEAIAVDVDRSEWQGCFLAQWPEGSDAHASYFDRIVAGPAYRLAEAVRIEG